MRVAIFTDNDFDKTNGVTTTLRAVLRHAPPDITPRIYTASDVGCDVPDYLALASTGIPIPCYREMRMYLPRLATFRRHLLADDVSLIHLTTPGPIGLAARRLAAASSLPTVGSFHTHLADYTRILTGSARLGRWMSAYMRWLYDRSERVLVPSADTAEQLGRAGWRRDRLTVWSRGVDTAAFAPSRHSPALRTSWRVCERRPALLYAGRVSREKGLDVLPQLERLLHQRHVPYRLIVAGSGPMLDDLRRGCPDAVFLGDVPHAQMGVVMASADLFVFPSGTETAGNVVLEAQASGLPVVVSDRGGAREQMVPGQTGLADGENAETLARAVVSILSNPQRRHAFADAARAYALTRTWDAALSPLFSAYRLTAAADALRRAPSFPGPMRTVT